MTTLKNLIYNILLTEPETRDSDKLLQWEVLNKMGFVKYSGFDKWITKENFMSAPAFESIRRCRQALQRSYLLTGRKLIQPTTKVKKQRVKLSKEKGIGFIQGNYKFDEVSQTYKQL